MAAGEGWGLLSGAQSSLGRLCRGGEGDSRHKPCVGGKLLMTCCGPAAPDACWESGGRSPEVTDQMSLTEKGGNVPCGKARNVRKRELQTWTPKQPTKIGKGEAVLVPKLGTGLVLKASAVWKEKEKCASAYLSCSAPTRQTSL